MTSTQELSRREFLAVSLQAGAVTAAMHPPALAGDAVAGPRWPQWRGPARDGVSPNARLPEVWPKKPPAPRWTMPIGAGYSAPVVLDGRLYTMAREDAEELILAADAATGRALWRLSYPAPYTAPSAGAGHGSGPNATVTVDAGQLYALGRFGKFHCVATDTGRICWSHDFQKDFDSPLVLFGMAASPLTEGDLVISLVGGPKAGTLAAFSKITGEMKWQSLQDRVSYSSPLGVTIAGVRQIVTLTRERLVGLGPGEGALLWSFPYAFMAEYGIVTPTVIGDMVIVAGVERPTVAVRVERDPGGKFAATEAWRSDLRGHMASPVAHAGHLYGLYDGQFVCLRLQDGKVAWSHDDAGEYVSLVIAADRLLILNESGELTVIRLTPDRYQEYAQWKLSDRPTWAHLALVGSQLYVRDSQELLCFDLKTS